MDKLTDAVAVKEDTNLYTEKGDSFLSFAAGGVTDMVDLASVVVSTTDAKQVADYDADTTRGELQSFKLDLDAREITMTFDEIMKISTFKASAVTIQSAAAYGDGTSTHKRQLEGSTIKAGSKDSGIVVISLSIKDQVALGENTDLATDLSNTFITMRATAFDDTLGRDVTSVTDGNGKVASVVDTDSTSPTVSSSTLDLDDETITIVFDEPVNKDTFTATAITLLSDASKVSDTQVRTLTSTWQSTATEPSDDRTTFIVTLGQDDLDAIKLHNVMAVGDVDAAGSGDGQTSSLFLSYTSDLVDDFASQAATAVLDSAADEVTSVVADTTSPELSFFKIDMENGVITLTFNEPILASTLDAQKFTVQDAATATVEYELTGGVESTTNGRIATIALTGSDLDNLKRFALASGETDTYIRLTDEAVKDMNDQQVSAKADGFAIRASAYEGDASAPTLESFDLDMNNEKLTMTFSETVLASSVEETKFAIANKAVGEAGHKLVSLQIDSTASTVDHTIVTISLSTSDMNVLKEDATLAQDGASTKLSITAAALADLSGNPIAAAFVAVTTYTPDSTNPDLADFSIDLDDGKIALTFSETVKSSSLDTTKITLSDGAGFTLVLKDGSDATSEPATVVEFTLDGDDLDTIKYTDAFVTATAAGSGNTDNTFVSFPVTLIEDMAKVPNAVNLVNDKGVATGGFTADTTKPAVYDFEVDVNGGFLIVTFTEPLEASPLDVTALTLSNADGTSQYSLKTGSTSTLSSNNMIVTVALSIDDLNQIKARKLLATSEASSLLLAGSSFATDKSGNQLTATTQDDVLIPRTFDEDETRPELVSFELDLENKKIRLSFSETVDAESIKPEGFTLSSEKSETSEHYTLTGGDVVEDDDCN